MENIDKAKVILKRKYEELQTFSTIYNNKATAQREALMNEHKEAFKKNPESFNIIDIAKNMFYLNGFYQADIRKLQIQLLESYNLVKELFPGIDLSKEIEDTIVILKGNLPKQVFIVKDGEFKEIEKGKVAKLSKDFEEKGYYKMFEDQIKKILNA